MNFIEELKNLDLEDIGRWPFIFRAGLVLTFFIVMVSFGIYFVIVEDRYVILQRVQTEEVTLRSIFENKQRKAANYDAYKVQLGQIEESFGTMLRQLPGETEIPNLMVDISQTGLAAGLQEKLFQPQLELPMDFYAEKPITISLKGGFHQIANFVSGVASLPRIVTLHDIIISPEKEDNYDDLVFEVTAKTYRYIDETGAKKE